MITRMLHEGHFRCMGLLLQRGIDPNVAQVSGRPPCISRPDGMAKSAERSAPVSPRCSSTTERDSTSAMTCWNQLRSAGPAGGDEKELVDLLIARGAAVNKPDAEPWATRTPGPESIERAAGKTAIPSKPTNVGSELNQ